MDATKYKKSARALFSKAAGNYGLSFRETLNGSYYYLDEERKTKGRMPMSLEISARAESFSSFFAPAGDDSNARIAQINGFFTAEGLAENVVVESGIMRVDVIGERQIKYHFYFNAGVERYRFVGVKNVTPLSPLRSITTLHAEIIPANGTAPIAKGEMFFHKDKFLSFLISFRLINK